MNGKQRASTVSVLMERCVVDPSRTSFVLKTTQKSVTRIATIGGEGERGNKQSDQSDSKRSGQRSRWKTQARLDGRKQSHMNDLQAKENKVRRRSETGLRTTTGGGMGRLSVVKNRIHMTVGYIQLNVVIASRFQLQHSDAVRMRSFLSAPSRSTQGVDHCERGA